MWVANGTWMDIAYAIGQLSQHCAQPTIRHWNAVLRILRYLKGTRDYAVVYGRETQGPEAGLLGYSDADYAGDKEDRHSTTGHLFLLNRGPISWTSTKQRFMATSTTESEYIALAEAGKQSQWLRALLKELQCEQLLGDSLAIERQSGLHRNCPGPDQPQPDKAHRCALSLYPAAGNVRKSHDRLRPYREYAS